MALKVFSMWNLEEEAQVEIQKILQPVNGTLKVLPKFPITTTGGNESKFGGSEQEQAKVQREAFLLEHLPDTEVLISGSISPEQLKVARALKWINVPFAGVNNLLSTKEIVKSDIIVTNSVGVSAPALADQIIGYVISFSRSIMQQLKAQLEHRWVSSSDFRLVELSGQTLGIVGYGSIGREVAKRAKAFGMKVVATKTNTEGDYPELDLLWPNSGLDDLLAQSDYVVICAPLTPQTRGLIGREQLEKMKNSAYLINIARGQLVRESELIQILQEKRIAGAALDVFEREPLPEESPLWHLDNVILTPHSSGNFEGFMNRSIELFCKNLSRYIAQEPLINVVDKNRGY